MTIEELQKDGKLIVESRMEGDFEGFDDEMLFPLSNGQYWIQSEYKYWYHYAYRPPVEVYYLSGQYYLRIEGHAQIVKVKQITDVTEATIVNDYNGWTGDTVFELDNGQIWKQDEYAYTYNYSYRPKALIYEANGVHKILVEGERVRVKRIK